MVGRADKLTVLRSWPGFLRIPCGVADGLAGSDVADKLLRKLGTATATDGVGAEEAEDGTGWPTSLGKDNADDAMFA
jgi:hypothetical protein